MKKERKKPEQKRTFWINIRLTETEYNALKDKLRTTTCQKMSEYVRLVLYQKPVIVKTRDQSLDELMRELIRLRRDLNSIGNNFNQVVKKINSSQHLQALTYWSETAAEFQRQLLKKTGNIQQRINDLTDKWLQT